MEGRDQLGIEGQCGHKMTVSAAKSEVVGGTLGAEKGRKNSGCGLNIRLWDYEDDKNLK